MPIFMRKIMQFIFMHFPITSFALKNQDGMKSLRSLDYAKRTAHFLSPGPSTYADRYIEAYLIVTISWITVQFQTLYVFFELEPSVRARHGIGLRFQVRDNQTEKSNRYEQVQTG